MVWVFPLMKNFFWLSPFETFHYPLSACCRQFQSHTSRHLCFVAHEGRWEAHSNHSPIPGLVYSIYPSICLPSCQPARLLGSQCVWMLLCLSCCPLTSPPGCLPTGPSCLPVSAPDGLPVFFPCSLLSCQSVVSPPLLPARLTALLYAAVRMSHLKFNTKGHNMDSKLFFSKCHFAKWEHQGTFTFLNGNKCVQSLQEILY